jgi:coenzyme F420-reducing hydrogenase alpha subunit
LSAIENAFSIQVSQETIILRQLLSAAQTIKSHMLHLFFLALPDYAGLKSSIELSTKYPAEFHSMLNVKKVADELLTVIGGTSAFPTDTTVGGFIKPVDIKQLLAISTEISNVIDEAQDFISLFNDIKTPDLNVNTKLATITPRTKSYPFYLGTFTQTIKEVVQAHSTAKLGLLGNKVIKTGALARLNYYSDNLAIRAKKAFKNINLDLKNPFNNNTAQTVEILHLLENSMALIYKLINKNLKNSVVVTEQKLPRKIVSGQAALEAPRGILIHKVKISPQGTILSYNITPPTQINLASLEKEAQKLIKQQKNLSQEEVKKQIQELIRAFDPCITCAVH